MIRIYKFYYINDYIIEFLNKICDYGVKFICIFKVVKGLK